VADLLDADVLDFRLVMRIAELEDQLVRRKRHIERLGRGGRTRKTDNGDRGGGKGGTEGGEHDRFPFARSTPSNRLVSSPFYPIGREPSLRQPFSLPSFTGNASAKKKRPKRRSGRMSQSEARFVFAGSPGSPIIAIGIRVRVRVIARRAAMTDI